MKTEVYTKVNKEKVVLFMHHYLRLLAKYSDLEILEACGRLDTNCFEVRHIIHFSTKILHTFIRKVGI